MSVKTEKIIPVILCGGFGRRLWPLSRENLPKQFLDLQGEGASLLQATVLRSRMYEGVLSKDVVVVTSADTAEEVTQQISALDTGQKMHILREPAARNTAAAVAYAAVYARRHFGNDAVLWVLPADHHVGDEDVLAGALKEAVETASEGYLVTFGIAPTRPETGYGYIAQGSVLNGGSARFVERFVEKPDQETAQSYLESGDYLWNSGMFVFRADQSLEAFQRHAGQILTGVESAMAQGHEKMPAAQSWNVIPEAPIDKAIMEKADNVAVVPCNPEWSDIGGFESLWECREKDAFGNAVSGDVLYADTKDCLVLGDRRLVACVGLEDIAIVDTPDAVLVMNKSVAGESLKSVVQTLQKEERVEASQPTTEFRPWGSFTVLSEAPAYKVKEITVKPGHSLSLQSHARRAEYWTIVSGQAVVTLNGKQTPLKAHESISIPRGAVHRVANPHKSMDMVFVEVQTGDYFGEDDIVRYEDAYGRSPKAVAG